MRAYRVHLRMPSCGRAFENVEVIGRDMRYAYALVGRDILNRYRIVLDGPHEKWSCP
jgi:hypothetical protein